MATYSANLSSNLSLYLQVTESNVNNVANTSVVNTTLYISGTGNGAWSNYTTYGYVNINGTRYDFSVGSYDFDGSVYRVLKTASQTITHNTDGSKTVAVSGYWDPGNYEWLDDVSVGGNFALTTIPRDSTFAPSAVTMGSPITLNVNVSPATVTHWLEIAYNGTTIVPDTDISANLTTFTLSGAQWTSLYNLTTTVAVAPVVMSLTSKRGDGTTIGTNSKTVNFTYAATDIPSLTSVTMAETNTAVSAITSLRLQDLSVLQFTINGAAGSKGSTITGYEIIVGKNAYSTSTATYTPNVVETVAVSARVKDSRGRWSAAKTLSFVVTAYSVPKINLLLVKRASDASGTEDIIGTFAKTIFSASVAAITGNKLFYQIDDITSTRVTKVAKTDSTVQSVSNLSKSFSSYPILSVGVFQLIITDSFNKTALSTIVLPTAQVPFSLGKTGGAFGKIFSAGGAVFQVSGDATIEGLLTVSNLAINRALNLGTTVNLGSTGTSFAGKKMAVNNSTELNCNNLTDEWALGKIGTGASNYPDNNAQWYINTIHAGSNKKQIAYGYNSPKVYTRYYNGSWSAWNQIIVEIESGGNSNTGYAKYSDGRMVQWKTISYTNLAVTTALGTNSAWSGDILLGDWYSTFTTVESAISYKHRISSVGAILNFSGAGVSSAGKMYVSLVGRGDTVASLTVKIEAEGTW